MKIDCQIEVLIQQYLDRELDAPRQEKLRDHLAHCPTCRAAYRPLLETIQDVENGPPPQLPAGLLERVLEQLPGVPLATDTHHLSIRRSLIWFSGITAAAAIVLILVGRMHMAPQPAPGTTEMAAARMDPQAVMILASAACTAPMGNTSSSVMLAAGQMAAWNAEQADGQPARITLSMTMPPANQPDMAPGTDLIQAITKSAALHGGV